MQIAGRGSHSRSGRLFNSKVSLRWWYTPRERPAAPRQSAPCGHCPRMRAPPAAPPGGGTTWPAWRNPAPRLTPCPAAVPSAACSHGTGFVNPLKICVSAALHTVSLHHTSVIMRLPRPEHHGAQQWAPWADNPCSRLLQALHSPLHAAQRPLLSRSRSQLHSAGNAQEYTM
jgi:hypothetical protein